MDEDNQSVAFNSAYLFDNDAPTPAALNNPNEDNENDPFAELFGDEMEEEDEGANLLGDDMER